MTDWVYSFMIWLIDCIIQKITIKGLINNKTVFFLINRIHIKQYIWFQNWSHVLLNHIKFYSFLYKLFWFIIKTLSDIDRYRSMLTQHKCIMDAVENSTSQLNQNLHMNDFKYHWPVKSCKAFGGIAKIPTEASAIANEAKNILFVIFK